MSILDEIVAHKRVELAATPEAEITVASLKAQVMARGGVIRVETLPGFGIPLHRDAVYKRP